jgi:hypothetical protein
LIVTDTSGGTAPDPVDLARISLRLTDAPVEDIAKVVITLLSIELNSNTLEKSLSITFDTAKTVDLLSLQGLHTETLLSSLEIPAGDYHEIRLIIDDSPLSTYIELSDGSIHDLKVPSGSESGLKIDGLWSIDADQTAAYTIDFDLLKSVVKAGASGKYLLKPVLRIVDDATTGHIRGTVDPALLSAASCSDSDPETHSVAYVYSGANVTPADVDLSIDSDVDPITTANIVMDSTTGDFIFEAAFLEAGDYTVAFTCNADLEDPESSEDLLFFGTQNATVLVNNILFL